MERGEERGEERKTRSGLEYSGDSRAFHSPLTHKYTPFKQTSSQLFVGMILILIFAEALGLYGLIVALILSQNSFVCEVGN